MSYSTGSGYNYTQRGDVVLTNRTGTTRYNPSNYKPYVLLKGVDTTITFFIKGDDTSATPLHDKIITAQLIRRNVDNVSLTKNLRIADYEKGVASLTVNASEIQALESGYYKLILTYTDSANQKTALYADQNRRVEFSCEIKDNVIPAYDNSNSAADFTASLNDNIYTSEYITGPAQQNNPNGLNTIAVYATEASGTFTAHATLELSPVETDWFPIALTPTGAFDMNDFTGVEAFIFDGMYMWVRFTHDLSQGTIDKVLYRS